MKTKALSLLLALILILGLAAPAAAAEDEYITSGEWTYKVVDGGIALTNYLGTATDVVVPAEIDGLKVVALGTGNYDDAPFQNIQLTSVTMPDGLDRLSRGCFAGQLGLTEVVIPDTVTSIGSSCFSGCDNLTSVDMPENLTEIQMWAFSGCDGLETIELPESLEYIEQLAFENCTSLKEITVPCSTGFWTFHGCTALEKVTIAGTVGTVGDLAFEGCTALTELVIEDGVKALGEGAFLNTGLTSVFIPASVTTMDYYCVGYTGEVSQTGWINETDALDSFVIRGYANTAAEEYASFFRFPFIPEGQYNPIEGKCGEDAYWSFDPITCKLSIWGGGMMDYYDDFDEYPWYGLRDQIISVDIKGVWNVGGGAFYQDYPSLTEVTIGDGVHSVGSNCFAYCANLETVTLGEGVSIGTDCFKESGLRSITLPDSEDTVAQNAFRNCKNLQEVKMGDNVTEIISGAFYGCTSLKEIDLPDSLWLIDFQAFAHSGLERVELPDGVECMHSSTFLGCEDLEYVKLPAGLIEVGSDVFRECTSLTDVVMPQGMNPDFGMNFFLDCDSLTDISFHTAPSIGQGMYLNCDGLNSVVIPYGVTDIQNNAFAYCVNLSYVSVPETVTAIGNQAFAACGRLKTVAFRGDAPAFTGNVFAADELTCYYPASNDTWTMEVMQQYGGKVTWLPYEVLPFTDVPVDSFYFAPVSWAVENGITNGISDTEFGSNAACNRAQVVTFLWRAEGCPEPTAAVNPFVDVEAGSFYEKAVLWAVEQGITNGIDDTHFGPNLSCNRATVVTLLHRAFGSPAVKNGDNPFTDVPYDSWYTLPVLWAVEQQITNGMGGGLFGVNDICNRAQIVTFLYRAYTE